MVRERARSLSPVSQQLGASIGTSLLNTIFATAVTSYLGAVGAISPEASHQTAAANHWRSDREQPSHASGTFAENDCSQLAHR
jgi:hypothetical protein